MKRRLVVVLASLGLIASSGFGLTAMADPPSPDNPAGAGNEILGVVPARGLADAPGQSQGQGQGHSQGGGGAKTSSSGSNLSYHGGPVLQTNTVVPIYWDPSGGLWSSAGATTYAGLINQFFSDVQSASSGQAQDNVYWSDTQYSDGSGNIKFSVTASSSFNDTQTYPTNGCSDSYTAVCLSDAQLRTEIQRLITDNSVPKGAGFIYFMFTPKGVGSCYSSNSCAFSQYCAYHSNLTAGSATYEYANMPYADTVPSACDNGPHPNGNDADATLNVTSHEHNEAITDPLGTAWYDKRGYEDGDKCAWTFGTMLGGTGNSVYNQVINGHPYYLQREWSNHSSGCVLQGL